MGLCHPWAQEVYLVEDVFWIQGRDTCVFKEVRSILFVFTQSYPYITYIMLISILLRYYLIKNLFQNYI